MNISTKISNFIFNVFMIGVFICSAISFIFVLSDFKDSFYKNSLESKTAYTKQGEFLEKNQNIINKYNKNINSSINMTYYK